MRMRLNSLSNSCRPGQQNPLHEGAHADWWMDEDEAKFALEQLPSRLQLEVLEFWQGPRSRGPAK